MGAARIKPDIERVAVLDPVLRIRFADGLEHFDGVDRLPDLNALFLDLLRNQFDQVLRLRMQLAGLLVQRTGAIEYAPLGVAGTESSRDGLAIMPCRRALPQAG